MATRDSSKTGRPDYSWLRELLDRTSPVPLYYQLARELESAIDSGYLAHGELLGNEIELADRLRISRPTVRRGIAMLADKGLVIRRRGVGTIVASTRVKRPIALTSLYDDLVASGESPRTVVLQVKSVTAEAAVAEALGICQGGHVLRIERLRYAHNEAVALMLNYLPAGTLHGGADQLGQSGLYQLLRQSGIQLCIAAQRITATSAHRREAGLLGIPEGAPMLAMTRTAYGQSGQPVEYGTHVYPATRYAFEMNLVSK